MFSGLSGLRNHQTALDVIGNNIANVNTVGYKSSSIQFSELLSQTIRGAGSPASTGTGGTNALQVGLGIATASIDVSQQQGSLQSTGNMSDIALQGNGFFILGDGQKQAYTRAGQFSFDANGSMVAANGMKVLGWMADTTGKINSNSNIQGLVIPVGKTIDAHATTTVDYAHNLSSTSDMLGTPKLAAGNSANVGVVSGTYTGNATAVDTLGNSFPITNVVGSHYLTINAETQTGTRTNLNGTESLSSLGSSNVSTFRVVVDGVSNAITLANGSNSTVNELISSINAQITGVTAELSGNAIKLTRNVAGANATVSVEDTGSATDGIAANVFGTGNAVWTSGAYNQGSTVLGGSPSVAGALPLTTWPTLSLTQKLNVTVNEATGAKTIAFTPTGTETTLNDLITSFNTWGASAGFAKPVKMSVNNAGKLVIESKDPSVGATGLSVADAGAGGIKASLMGVTTQVGRTSVAASVTHQFIEANGGGTHSTQLSFSNGDAQISGLTGVSIVAGTTGFKAGTVVVQTVAAAEHVATTQVYDSLGQSHTINVTLKRQADNTWKWDAGGTDVVGSGTLTFDANGIIQSGSVSGNITIGASGGANSISLTPNFSNVTQYASASTMLHVSQDGYTDGSLSTYSIDANGQILGIYTNGLNQTIGQVAVAAFNNPSGLMKAGDSTFIASNNSGTAQVGSANTGGRGSFSAGTLEMSNVDIAQEFANMIIYERGFQANSKVITTGDDMLQTLVGMKR